MQSPAQGQGKMGEKPPSNHQAAPSSKWSFLPRVRKCMKSPISRACGPRRAGGLGSLTPHPLCPYPSLLSPKACAPPCCSQPGTSRIINTTRGSEHGALSPNEVAKERKHMTPALRPTTNSGAASCGGRDLTHSPDRGPGGMTCPVSHAGLCSQDKRAEHSHLPTPPRVPSPDTSASSSLVPSLQTSLCVLPSCQFTTQPREDTQQSAEQRD